MDLEIDKHYAEDMISALDSSLAPVNNYNEIFKKPYVTFPEIYSVILKMPFGYRIIKFESTTIESLINNGEIKLIETELRNNLVRYNREKEGLLFIYSEITKSSDDILRNIPMDGGTLVLKL